MEATKNPNPMTPPEEIGMEGATLHDGSQHDRIFPVVSQAANRRLIVDWIESQENYSAVNESTDVLTGDFDCLIVDRPALAEIGQSLVERKEHEELVLPVVLLVDETEERQTRDELRQKHPDVFNAINSIVPMPLAEYQFADQIETLLQMREQSRKLATQREQLQAIRDEHSGHGVVITDGDGAIQYVNRAFEQQSGYAEEEVVGKNPRIVQSGEHDESFYEEMWETISSGAVWQGEVINNRKDGERYVLNQTIAPVTDVDGEIYRFIAVNHEITDLKELETNLRNQTEQLAILNRVLRHDIRNDLNIILGWTNMLEAHVDEAGEEYLDRIAQTGEHIVELTEVAGDLATQFTTDEGPELEAVNVSRVLNEEVEKRREAFEEASIELRNELSPETTVRANTMLSSVFRNLINNAVQHNDSPDPAVEINSSKQDETVVIKIADNGPGIPDSHKAEIFSKARKGLDSEGTGMGLYLVQTLIETFEGDVWVEDNDPEGAIFVVELPITESSPSTAGAIS
jgi:PAS domain S-box-containing protein